VQALGGAKNHAVILPDADLDLAADAMINAGFGSAGERCMAISACVAVGPIADDLVAKITERAAGIKTGDGTQDSDMGPLVTKAHRDKVASYIDAGEADALEAYPRALATVEAARTELSSEGYMYRYRPDDRPLGEAEGAFLLCGFTMALALHQHGRDVEAVRWFERNRAACGPPGLLTEEYDILQRQVRGNAPQAFVHALLLESAQRLASPWPAQAGPHPQNSGGLE